MTLQISHECLLFGYSRINCIRSVLRKLGIRHEASVNGLVALMQKRLILCLKASQPRNFDAQDVLVSALQQMSTVG
jgi:hypothetical protein